MDSEMADPILSQDSFDDSNSDSLQSEKVAAEQIDNSPQIVEDLSKSDQKKNITKMAGGDNKTKIQDAKKSKDKKSKKAVAASVETLMNSLKSLTLEQQVTTILAKHSEVIEENIHLQKSVKNAEKQAQLAYKEKEQVEAEHAKAVLTKSRLESVCRELQRQNKTIKDENTARLKEEEKRRKETSNHFNNTLGAITTLMQENTDKNTKLRDENQEMSKWVKDLIKQYEKREEEVEKILKERDLQVQLADAKLAKFKMDFTEEKEKLLLEKKSHLEELASYQQKATEMSMVEIQLRQQLSSYNEKYEEFQGTLEKSKELFNNFKKEMDEMTKKIKKLEKETKYYKERWEGSNKAILDMVNERTAMENTIETLTKQNSQLQNLCRAFQNQMRSGKTDNDSEEPNTESTETKDKVEENCTNQETIKEEEKEIKLPSEPENEMKIKVESSLSEEPKNEAKEESSLNEEPKNEVKEESSLNEEPKNEVKEESSLNEEPKNEVKGESLNEVEENCEATQVSSMDDVD